MENKLLLTFGLVIAIVGSVVSRVLSGRLLGTQIGWGLSAIVGIASLIAGIATMIGFSSYAPDSTFFTLLPFIIYFLTAAVLAKLFVKDDAAAPGTAESLLFGFTVTAGTGLATLGMVLVGIIFAYLFR